MSLTNFGNTTTTNAPLFGASAPAAGGLVGGAGPLAAVTLSTRYNDLPDAVRQQVDEIEYPFLVLEVGLDISKESSRVVSGNSSSHRFKSLSRWMPRP
jgi:hypothetical protein